jgi:osmotically-inducible protein OsmY
MRARPSRRCRRRAGALAAAGLALALLAPPGAAAEDPARDRELRERIEERLAALPELDGAEIRVLLQAGQVVLQGSVLLLEQSLRAEQSVWTTPGVVDVENELRVVRREEVADDVIERQVRSILKGDGRFLDAQLRLQVEAGVVRLHGTFADPVDVLALKHRVAAVPGVRDVRIDAVLTALQRPARPPRP